MLKHGTILTCFKSNTKKKNAKVIIFLNMNENDFNSEGIKPNSM